MVCSHFPKGKDFNEELVFLVNKMITLKQKVDFCSSSRALIRLGYNLYNSYSDKYTTTIDILYGFDINYVLALNSLY